MISPRAVSVPIAIRRCRFDVPPGAKATAHPETSLTCEAGLRSKHAFDWSVLSGIEGEIK
jgi:hypothetical protein